MKMNALGRLMLNSPGRAYAQRRHVIPLMARIGGRLDGCEVLEIGCGRGVGAELLLQQMGAAHVEAIDLDPLMVSRAAARLRGRPTNVECGDMTQMRFDTASFDAVVDFGAIHLEPEWQLAVKEIGRVLRPGGRFLFEEIVGRTYRAVVPLATGRRIVGALTGPVFLAELRACGFEPLGVRRPALAISGAVGDLVGAARVR
jgi:ubiquinone/menaquinone biosynthesis C-methylase UbiE